MSTEFEYKKPWYWKRTNDGGSYHPCQPLNAQGNPSGPMEYGISLRDHFAGLAMQAAMVNATGLGHLSQEHRAQMLDDAAALFYEVSDAMLRVRESRKT